MMRWATKMRMAFISDMLAKSGAINRRDIMEYFEVSASQAAADFRTFQHERPGEMRYDKSRKAYVAVKNAKSGRNTTAAASRLIYADDAELDLIARHDPDMIRDVAAALIYERKP